MRIASRPLLAGLLVLSLAGLTGCGLFGSSSGGGMKQEIGEQIWRSRDNQFVRLESQDAPPGQTPPPNAHPVQISESQIRNALARLDVRVERDEDPVPVFNDYQLKVVPEAISEALAKAKPNQDVTFALVGFHKGGLVEFLKEPKLTTGRLFYANNRLNLIFGKVHDVKSQGRTTGAGRVEPDPRLNPHVPGMRSFTSKHQWQLVVPPGSGIYRPQASNRTDWVVMETEAFTPPPASTYARRGGDVPADASPQQYEQLRQEVERLRRDLQSVQQGGGGQPAPAYAPPPPPARTGPATGAGSPRQRLMVLEDLWNKGLISDEEYQRKRQQILSGF